MATSNTRQRRFIAAGDAPPIPEHGVSTRYMRLQNTLVAWSEDWADSATLRQDASAEIFVILPDTGAVLSGNGAKAEAPPRSISMLPAGPTTIDLTSPGRVIRIFSPVPEALAPRAINGGTTPRRERISPHAEHLCTGSRGSHPAPGFAALSKGALQLYLNKPGAGGAGRAMDDGRTPAPGGWNRFQIEIDDLAATVEKLKGSGHRFRNEIVTGNSGKQILIEDPSGNAIELFEPFTGEGIPQNRPNR